MFLILVYFVKRLANTGIFTTIVCLEIKCTPSMLKSRSELKFPFNILCTDCVVLIVYSIKWLKISNEEVKSTSV